MTRLGTWLGHRWCGLTTGHYFLRTTWDHRAVLRCWYCDYVSPGWSLALPPPPTTVPRNVCTFDGGVCEPEADCGVCRYCGARLTPELRLHVCETHEAEP